MREGGLQHKQTRASAGTPNSPTSSDVRLNGLILTFAVVAVGQLCSVGLIEQIEYTIAFNACRPKH